MRLFQSLALGLALAALTCASLPVQADEEPILQYNRLNRPSDTIGRIGSSLFGESVDLYSSQTEFSNTNIAIPGNSALPVRLGRHLKAAEGDHYGTLSSFANWEIDVPHLSGYFAGAGWVVGDSGSVNRCSVPLGQIGSAVPPTEGGLNREVQFP